MKINITDKELLTLITSGKGCKYKVPDKKKVIAELQYLYTIISVIDDISELSYYKTIDSIQTPVGNDSFLLPINSKSDMALSLRFADNTVTFLALVNISHYEKGR